MLFNGCRHQWCRRCLAYTQLFSSFRTIVDLSVPWNEPETVLNTLINAKRNDGSGKLVKTMAQDTSTDCCVPCIVIEFPFAGSQREREKGWKEREKDNDFLGSCHSEMSQPTQPNQPHSRRTYTYIVHTHCWLHIYHKKNYVILVP